MKIAFAPIQGYSFWKYRELYNKYIGDIDEYYSPFIVKQKDGSIKSSHLNEIEQENNLDLNLVPQFACANSEDFNFFINLLQGKSYDKFNWNMGCPFPMLVKRSMGCGIMSKPELIKEILDSAEFDTTKLSIKMRLGFDNNIDIYKLLDVLNNYKLNEIIIHPRTGKQAYKGEVDLDSFEKAKSISENKIIYNGDINSLEDYEYLMDRFPDFGKIMIGRGILKDIFLCSKIKGSEQLNQSQKKELLHNFHAEMLDFAINTYCGDKQIMLKMISFWEYFSEHFDDQRKIFKLIKKSVNPQKYLTAVNNAFSRDIIC
ncbi:MAG: tRNA-dihydrouridine synthase family protein [Marinifilaceae bacterium]|jgi:tRNA-dihydrouridine synthase|nr:tRNA-dihydrouridine synthase family protein [Marinifilaceae bacterium]